MYIRFAVFHTKVKKTYQLKVLTMFFIQLYIRKRLCKTMLSKETN